MRASFLNHRNICCGFVLLVFSGCVIVPVPRHDTAETRCNISEQKVSVFKPGVTTRREIILALGEPDVVSINERKLVYCRQQVVAWIIVAAPAAGDAENVCDTDFFVAEFDTLGVLTTFAEVKNLPEMIPRQSSYEGHKVHLQKRATWYPDLNGFKPMWHESSYGDIGQVLLTDVELIFIAYAPFANDGPDCRIAYTAIAEVRLDAFITARRLVVRDKTGKLNSFDILKPKGWIVTDKESSMQVYEFLKKRIMN